MKIPRLHACTQDTHTHQNNGHIFTTNCMQVDVSTQKQCQRGCAIYAGEGAPCLFVTWGNGRCLYKNGNTSVYGCQGCDSNGYCTQKTTPCDPSFQYCSANIIRKGEPKSSHRPRTTESTTILPIALMGEWAKYTHLTLYGFILFLCTLNLTRSRPCMHS